MKQPNKVVPIRYSAEVNNDIKQGYSLDCASLHYCTGFNYILGLQFLREAIMTSTIILWLQRCSLGAHNSYYKLTYRTLMNYVITKNTGSEEPIFHYIIHYQLVLSPTARSPEFAHTGKHCVLLLHGFLFLFFFFRAYT